MLDSPRRNNLGSCSVCQTKIPRGLVHRTLRWECIHNISRHHPRHQNPVKKAKTRDINIRQPVIFSWQLPITLLTSQQVLQSLWPWHSVPLAAHSLRSREKIIATQIFVRKLHVYNIGWDVSHAPSASLASLANHRDNRRGGTRGHRVMCQGAWAPATRHSCPRCSYLFSFWKGKKEKWELCFGCAFFVWKMTWLCTPRPN